MTDSNFSHHDKTDNRLWTTVAVALIALIIGYAGGYFTKNGTTKAPTSTQASANGGSGGFPGGGGGSGGARRSFDSGAVTAVSSTSITINNTQTSASQTFSITSATTVTDSGSASSVSAISVGETVAVIPDSTTTTQASRIMINPSFGGFSPQDNSGSTGNSGNGT